MADGTKNMMTDARPEASESIVIVSGLPRSGTSMIMQMLEAGGVAILSDGKRQADDDNPKGYYELEAVKQTTDDPSWLERAPGKAVKMISQLLYDLPENTPGRVIFLRREMGEILESQRKMLARRRGTVSVGDPEDVAVTTGVEDEEMARIFATHLNEVLAWVAKREGLELLEVWHADVLREPDSVALRIQEFLGQALAVDAMAAVVDGGLHRNRVGVVSAEDYMDTDEEEAVAKRLRDLGYL
jgi:hypothetical protein